MTTGRKFLPISVWFLFFFFFMKKSFQEIFIETIMFTGKFKLPVCFSTSKIKIFRAVSKNVLTKDVHYLY